jgi:fluoride exporter
MPTALQAPIIISLGAIAGALCRYYLTLWATARWGSEFPYGTLMINLSGCWLIGCLSSFCLPPSIVSPNLRLLLMTGFLGAYTTFSTYGLESLTLFKQKPFSIASFYFWGSSILGLFCVQVGLWCGLIARNW